jgi:hypothetical protein
MDIESSQTQDIARMRYYLKEMKELFRKYPKSLCLRNGIHEVECRLGLEPSTSRVCPLQFLDSLDRRSG